MPTQSPMPPNRNRRILWMAAGLAICLMGATASTREARAADAADREFIARAAPVLRQFCFDCHGDEQAEAHVDFNRLLSKPDVAARFKDWEKAAFMLEAKRMPPEDMPQPSDEVRRRLAALIRNRLDEVMREQAGDPGRVVMRRLTSAEYEYTIRDLTGLDLPLARTLDFDAAGGAGFTNVGDVQFVQDSTLERYLEAAKLVASHAVVGAGPLEFYRDPGKTGRELSAIHRIQNVYRTHGFRTAAGEGGKPFGLELYPQALFAAWRFRHREALGRGGATLIELGAEDGVSARFVEHIWSVLNKRAATFPTSAIVAEWRALPAPEDANELLLRQVRGRCDGIYALLRDWQSMLATTSGDEEEAAVLTEGAVYASPKHSFSADLQWPEGAEKGVAQFTVASAGQTKATGAIVVWRRARIRFRREDNRWTRRRPFKDVLTEETRERLALGRHPAGAKIDDDDFALPADKLVEVAYRPPEGTKAAELFVEVALDLQHGADGIVRCSIADGEVEGETAAETGATSVLLANPQAESFESWREGVLELGSLLPEVSQREPAPSDRDPIPPPWDNTYNSSERNAFHYKIKYHRDDRFLTEHILSDDDRRRLDQAWADLLTSFEYHDTFLQFVAGKYDLELDGRGIADLHPQWIADLPPEPRQFVERLADQYASALRAVRAAQPGHVADALRFAELAWRRPLEMAEQDRLRSFYAELRESGAADHDGAVRALLARILTAPAFLYRAESPGRQQEIAPLSDWELASRLSYFLWSSPPDAELRRAAIAGELQVREQLARQSRRMLRDAKARRFAAEFFGQWFGFYRFDAYRGVDGERFPEFTESLKASMHDEAVSFFEHIVREDRPVDDILFADYAFLNRELAEHYGIETNAGLTSQPALVAGAGEFERGGLLRLGAVLTSTSAPLRTSAVKRGDWVLRRVLGTPVPPPPADAGSIPADDVLADGRTVRERLEAHRREASCVNCHSRIDPLGFALERFDAIGRWRDAYRDGQAIDAAGVLSDGTEIDGPDGLRRYLKQQRRQFRRTLCSKLLGYALGRGELLSDRMLIDGMMTDLETDGRFSSLVVSIATSKQFRHLRGGEEQPVSSIDDER